MVVLYGCAMNETDLLAEIRAMQNARADRTDAAIHSLRKEFSRRMDQQDGVLQSHTGMINVLQTQEALRSSTSKLAVHRVPHPGLRAPKLAAKFKRWTIITTSAIGLLTATIAAVPKGVWTTIRSWI